CQPGPPSSFSVKYHGNRPSKGCGSRTLSVPGTSVSAVKRCAACRTAGLAIRGAPNPLPGAQYLGNLSLGYPSAHPPAALIPGHALRIGRREVTSGDASALAVAARG